MKKIVFVFMSILMFSCSATSHTKLAGTYISTCILQMYPNVILELKQDNSFTYKLAYNEEKITGTWKLEKDSIILYSKWFEQKIIDSITPAYKNSNLLNRDAYLIQKDKLLVISNEGVSDKCFLKKKK